MKLSQADTFGIPFWRMYLPAVMYAQVLFAPLMWGTFYLLDATAKLPFPTDVDVVM